MARTTVQSLTLARVGLEKEVVKLYASQPRQWWQDFVQIHDSSQKYAIIAQQGDYPQAVVINEAEGAAYVDFDLPYSVTVYPLKRNLAIAVSTEAIETEQGYNVISIRSQKLALSMLKTKETECAGHFNLATSTASVDLGPDGKALAATDHPLATGTASNYGVSSTSVTLGITNLEQMVAALRRTKSHMGDPMSFQGPFDLLVGPELEWLAKRLTGADKVPQSNNNDPNAVKTTMGMVIPNPFFTSSTAWALLDKKDNGLKLLMRRAMKVRAWFDNNTDTENSSLTEIYAKYNDTWRGFQYSPGT